LSFLIRFLFVLALIGGSAQAQTSVKQLTRPEGAGRLPSSVQPVEPQTVVFLKLPDDPVATVRSRAPGRQLAEADARAIADDLSRKQDAIIPLIEARGGTVRSKLQHAVNGITVQVAPGKLAAVATIPGVVAVKPVLTYHTDNVESVPFIGADATWGGTPGFAGEGIKVFVIDTGVDYTHADFGGPGTAAAFNDAFAHSTEPANPAFFGPAAPKVKGGTDLVGDHYNANDPNSVPVPDPNPLDCNGHGTHTSGTATGFGVALDGQTFHGPYDASTAARPFIVGPGVAPLADLYHVRVFGCAGSTNVVTEAIDYAVAHGADVISMSLGADFGIADTADAEASQHAQEAGVIVVAASGNAGNIPYITSSPASGDKTVSVAAVDSHAGFPGADVALSTGTSIRAIDANGAAFADGTTLPVAVLRTSSGAISLGCNPAEYTAAGVAGKLVVTRRGVCARVARAVFGQKAGAAAVLMINNAAGLPPFEGPITSNPDTGEPFTVTIPFLGTGSTTAAAFLAANGGTARLTNAFIANPTFRRSASFSSAGARSGDGHLKPDISAPGVSVFSAGIGTGNSGFFLSGTSMATPHVAGSAALALQAHPGWDPDDVRKAMVNAADPSQLLGFVPRRNGAGLVQPFAATRSTVVATSGNDEPNVSFGVAEFDRDFTGSKVIKLRNLGSRRASFTVSATPVNGSPHTVSVSPSTIAIQPGASATVQVTLNVPAATTGDASAFREAGGIVSFSPATATSNNGIGLSVPYLLVPRARSLVATEISDDFGPARPSAFAEVRNNSRAVAGTADFYAWALRGRNRAAGSAGLRAVGAQSFDAGPGLGQLVVFAVNTFGAWSSPSTTIFSVFIDVNGDGNADFLVQTADLGLFTGTGFTGEVVSAAFNLNTGGGFLEFDAIAGTDQSTILIPVVAAEIGLTPDNPRFNYVQVESQDFAFGNTDVLAGSGGFNAFNNAITTGIGAALNPRDRVSLPISIDPAEWARTPALGLMVVGIENANANGEARQAQLIRVGGSEDVD
jgi:minor extracellular serine protease Vpr